MRKTCISLLFVPQTGVEPALTCVNSDLNAARLPIPPLRQLLEHIYHTKKLTKLERVISKNINYLFVISFRPTPSHTPCGRFHPLVL